MDEKEIAELAAKVATEVIEKSNETNRKITPGDVEITKSPEEKILEGKKGGFKSFGHFLIDLRHEEEPSETLSNYTNALRKTAGYMEEGDLSQGGYLVPEEFKAELLQKRLESSIVYARARRVPMATNRIVFPADVDDDHSADYFGGITIYRTAEGGDKTPKNPVFGQIALTLHKLTGYCVVSDELIQDSPISIEAIIRDKFSQAISFVQDYDFLRGNGVNQALGIFHAQNPALIPVVIESGQDADTIVYENIVKMWTRMYPAGHANAVWIANINTFPQLSGMNMAVGSGGVPVWMPAGGVSGAPYASLMGRPLLFTEKMATLGDLYDIGLVDLSQYIIGEKGGLNFATSIHIRFMQDEMAFRFVMRYDGQPTWLTTLTPKGGSSAGTLSPFITLAVRN